ncbi:hypothetical protein DI005_09395 [Prauserella sp. PE36]|uniref:YtxH domain-containing protein n=1 Tax=Prauserella endophytica TaxID=1592324 RepID=A0ABY2RYI6_9PSEU|nr:MULTISPECIES: hypothetical protein [Prauserella]PXY33599.1 hypothetical protein BAY59_10995 [Prauserella coralliicola]RBM21726.1 hypothetical protein DI005_09395 [Prauserella sp. PE36]TKG65757.1 hypothetical protein FCN18_26500 [Prauserella endophytica]
MKTFLLGAAVGYVLGARAGRARYEQIVRTYRKIADHPAVQGAAGVARAKVGEKVGDKLPFGHRSHTPQGANGQYATEPNASQA